jgi:hypothetical protein
MLVGPLRPGHQPATRSREGGQGGRHRAASWYEASVARRQPRRLCVLGAGVERRCHLGVEPSSPPAPELILQTTTDEGKTVPFIIQRVTGTANRGIYQIAVLVDPTRPITPWSTEQPWNRKYVNTFGGACSVNYQQPTVGDVRNVARLGLGFAVGTSSLNTYGNQCSDVISAEALMMTKESSPSAGGRSCTRSATAGPPARCSST